MVQLSHGSVLLAAGQAGPVSFADGLLILGAAVVFCWIVSLRWHPYTACLACKGKGKHFGAVATRSFRPCPTCGGNGRRKRNFANIWARNRTL